MRTGTAVLNFPDEQRKVLLAIGLSDHARVFLLNQYPACKFMGKVQYIHRLVATKLMGLALSRSVFIHHIDENRANFMPTNLRPMTQGQHNGIHKRCGPDNHFFGRSHSAESRMKMSRLVSSRQKGVRLSESHVRSLRVVATRRTRDSAGRFARASLSIDVA